MGTRSRTLYHDAPPGSMCPKENWWWPLAALPRCYRYGNDAAGRRRLCHDLAKIAEPAALRVGLEASGGYERKIAAALRKAGFAVIVFQPLQIRAYAQYIGQRAKTDPIDARLIALRRPPMMATPPERRKARATGRASDPDRADPRKISSASRPGGTASPSAASRSSSRLRSSA